MKFMKISMIHLTVAVLAIAFFAPVLFGLPQLADVPALVGLPQFGDASLLPLIAGFGMTTLAVNAPRAYELGNRNDIPMIASDIIYEGSAVGIVAGSGHARPLVAVDGFAGFAEAKADNSAGGAAAINVRVITSGLIQLPIGSLVITSVGLPVYASDDNTFTLTSVSNTMIGRVRRFVSAGVGVVAFEAYAS